MLSLFSENVFFLNYIILNKTFLICYFLGAKSIKLFSKYKKNSLEKKKRVGCLLIAKDIIFQRVLFS